MSALKALIAAMIMQLVTTLKGVTPALVTLGTQAMGSLAQVSAVIQSIYRILHSDIKLMSTLPTMEVATTTVITQLEVTHVPTIMATNITAQCTCEGSVKSMKRYNNPQKALPYI